MKRLLLFTLIILCFSTLAFADINDSWLEYGRTDRLDNWVSISQLQGLWSSDTNLTQQVVSSIGADFQPLIGDVDNDGQMEVVISDGNLLKIYEVNSTSRLMSLEDEINFGSSQSAMGAIIDDYNGNNLKEIIMPFGTNITVVEYNTTSINLLGSTDTGTFRTGVQCQGLGGATPDSCWWGNDTGYVVEYNLTSFTHTRYDFNAPSDAFDMGDVGNDNDGVFHAPAIQDIDRDGIQELIFMCDHDDDQDEGVCVFDTDSNAPDTYFSTDGIVEYANEEIRGLLITNTDGAGDSEIIITTHETGGTNDNRIRVLNADGSSKWNQNIAVGVNAISNPMLQDFADPVGFDICVIHYDLAPVAFEINCYDMNTQLHTLSRTLNSGTNNFIELDDGLEDPDIIVADVNQDTYYDIISGAGMYINITNSSSTFLSFPSGDMDYWASVGDVALQDDISIVAQKANELSFISSFNNNVGPTLDDTLQYSGYHGFYNPACVNTTQTYKAREDIGGVNGNYDNDNLFDTERLVTNCGFDSSGSPTSNTLLDTNNGTYDTTDPTFSCYYNTTGNFNVRIYIQDDKNDEDFTEYNPTSIPLTVIDGTPGVTCNNPNTLDSSVDQVALVSTATTVSGDEEIDSLLGIVTGGSTTLKLITGAGIVFGLAIAGAQAGGAIGMVIGAITGLIIATYATLFPIWIMILLLIGALLVFVMSRFILQTGGNT